MDPENVVNEGKSVLWIAAGIGVIYAAIQINRFLKKPGAFQDFANNHPNIAALGISFGITGPGGQIPDVTGEEGAQAEVKAAVYTAETSQGYYDAALLDFALENGYSVTGQGQFTKALSAQGSPDWPWTSFADWAANGFPALPTAHLVHVTENGAIINEYEDNQG